MNQISILTSVDTISTIGIFYCDILVDIVYAQNYLKEKYFLGGGKMISHEYVFLIILDKTIL